MTETPSPLSLYHRLMGLDWDRLDSAVRSFHDIDTPLFARGEFSVYKSENLPTRIMCGLIVLPPAGTNQPAKLAVTREDEEEVWVRTFTNRVFSTRQRCSKFGCLEEQIGALRIGFNLRAAGGALVYEQNGAAIAIGPIRLALPSWLAPIVSAREEPVLGCAGIEVTVIVTHVFWAELISYKGYIEKEDHPQ